MRVLAIMCHPDDMELSCSGTLIKCKKRGDDVIAVQRARAADRGSQCKTKYAEAYNQLLASQRLRTYRCLP